MDEHAQQPQIEVQDIDHLGIVAGIIDEIGLAEEIDRRVGTHPQEHVSSSQAVKAMILNGLGFVCAPLYLFGQFFSGKATEHLLGEGIKPEHLNDDRLGRVLDKLLKLISPRSSSGSPARPPGALAFPQRERSPRCHLFSSAPSLRRRTGARRDPHKLRLFPRASA